MCGRTSLANLPDHLRPFLQRYGVRDVPPWYTPRYNVAPSQDLMLIVDADGERTGRRMRWGLVPFWAKDPAMGTRMVNARCETVATKPAYREAFAKRRGLIVVDSYYEWRKNSSGSKTPFRIHRSDGTPFTIAALWERWGPQEDGIETCAVITTEANEFNGPHSRPDAGHRVRVPGRRLARQRVEPRTYPGRGRVRRERLEFPRRISLRQLARKRRRPLLGASSRR